MDPILMQAAASVAANLGQGIAASAVWDGLKAAFRSRTSAPQAEVEAALGGWLRVHGVNAQASTVIRLMAEAGLIDIRGSTFYAPEAIMMGAGEAAKFNFQNSLSTTRRTQIDASGGGISGQSGGVFQNPDGSIDFRVGPGGGISIFTNGGNVTFKTGG